MNYEEVAKKVASDHFAREQRGECPIAGKLISDIAAALRRAANEAAWDGYAQGQDGAYEESPRRATLVVDVMVSKYGPPPEGGTR